MSESREKLIGIVVALLLHLIVAIALTQDSIVKWLLPKPSPEKVVKKEEKPKTLLSFKITPKKQVVPKPIPKPPKKVQQPRFTRTTEDQPQEKPKNAKYLGAHDTVAQSNAAPNLNAPERASVAGQKESSEPNTASNFQKGDLKHTNRGQKVEPRQAVTPPAERPKSFVQPKSASAGAANPTREFLDALNKIPAQQRVKNPERKVKVAKAGKATSETEKKDAAKTKKSTLKTKSTEKTTKAVTKKSKSGFKPQSDPNKMVGSITRRGRISSSDVKSSPLGRYIQSVQNSVAKEWYRRIGQHPDLILPGALLVRWYVYDNGKVRVTFVKQLQGSEIQKGITVQAITTAKIPKMPAKLKKELRGDPVEITITFHF